MYSFRNDYNELCHKSVLEKFMKYYDEKNTSYGLDYHCENAKRLVKSYLSDKYDFDIHFVTGGTICNKTIIDQALKSYEAVISVDTGHINVHETGAIEALGHKIITVENEDGKITVDKIKEVVKSHSGCHMVVPKMVYISNSTELGSSYSLSELRQIKEVCEDYGLYLFIDGARLLVGLDSQNISLKEFSEIADVFYIGLTKCGGMFGEVVVIKNDNLKPNFTFTQKHNGALLAKGFSLGLQVEALFEDGLIFDLAKKANEASRYLAKKLKEINVRLYSISQTNQQFIIIDKLKLDKLSKAIDYEYWCDYDNSKVIRLVTTYSTDYAMIDKVIDLLK